MITSTTPNTFLVGAGAAATSLAGALRLGGVPVLGLWARNPEAARKSASAAGVAAYSAAPPDLVLEADVLILAVSDSAIAEVAKTLVGSGLVTRKHVMLHCSGAMSSADAFAGVRDQLGGVGVVHPLRAIVDPASAMRSFSATTFGVEGDEVGVGVARRLVKAMGGTAVELDGEQMASYHAAAAVASNFMVALADAAATLMEQAGIDRGRAVKALVPLMEGTVANLAESGVPEALTGPIRRGDGETIERHLGAVSAAGPEIEALYRLLGRRTVSLARTVGQAPAGNLDAIEEALDGEATASVESRAYRA